MLINLRRLPMPFLRVGAIRLTRYNARKRILNASINWLYLDNHNTRYTHVIKMKVARAQRKRMINA